MTVGTNPIRAFKEARRLTYEQLARELGISLDYAKKLGSGNNRTVSPQCAEKFERRTRGALRFNDVMAWVRDGLQDQAREKTA